MPPAPPSQQLLEGPILRSLMSLAIPIALANVLQAAYQLIDALQERLSRYKVPKRVLIVEELPRNSMGKVQKNVLRAAYASLYASSAD